MAVVNYHDGYGSFPPAFVRGPDGTPWHSWRVLILPFIGENSVFDKYRMDEPWNGPNNSKLAAEKPKIFSFPTRREPQDQSANYLAIVGANTFWPGDQPADDRALNWSSISLVENDGLNVHWMEPRDLPFDEMSFVLQSPNGVSSPYKLASVASADGSLQALDPDTSPEEVRELLMPKKRKEKTNANPHVHEIQDGRDRELK